MSDLVTGEAVPLELRLAKLPSRALALMIDWLVLGAVAVGLLLLLDQIMPSVDPALAAALIILSIVVVLVVIPTTIETLTRGMSLGKAALGLRVVRDDGGPIRFRHALVRALAGVFADFVITVGLGAVICSLLNSKDKRIGDLLAGTVVIRERIPSVDAPPPVVEPELAEWARTLDLSRLPDGLALSARTLLARAPQLAPESRDRLAGDLAGQVAQVVTPPPPVGTPPSTYLATVLAERRRRDAARYRPREPAGSAPTGSAPAGSAPVEGEPTQWAGAPERPEPTDRAGAPETSPAPRQPPDDPPRTAGGFAPPA